MTAGLFTAYFDASGHPDDANAAPALFVSGFLSTADKWKKFERDWLALLDAYGIKPPFHMTDFESGATQYASWKGDRPRREAFRLAALRIIRRRTHKPLSAGARQPTRAA